MESSYLPGHLRSASKPEVSPTFSHKTVPMVVNLAKVGLYKGEGVCLGVGGENGVERGERDLRGKGGATPLKRGMRVNSP